MAGRRRTPCEWCEDDYFPDYVTHRNGYCLWIEVYPNNNVITANAQANDEEGAMIEDWIETPMNYCPNCGRKIEAY